MKVLSPFVDHFSHRLVERIDPQLAIVIGQSWCSDNVDEVVWTPATLWNHLANRFEHWKLEQVSNCELGPTNSKSMKLELRKVLILALESKILYFPM